MTKSKLFIPDLMNNLKPNQKIVNSMFEDLNDPLTWWEKLYYPTYRFFVGVKYLVKDIGQVITTGFPHKQAWSFYGWHSGVVVKRLKFLRQDTKGWPMGLTLEEWNDILDQIIWSFEHCEDDVPVEYPPGYDHRWLQEKHESGSISMTPLGKGKLDRSKQIAHSKRINKGLHLFAKYYFDLWS